MYLLRISYRFVITTTTVTPKIEEHCRIFHSHPTDKIIRRTTFEHLKHFFPFEMLLPNTLNVYMKFWKTFGLFSTYYSKISKNIQTNLFIKKKLGENAILSVVVFVTLVL